MDISSIYGSSALDSTAYTNAANQTASKLQNQLNGSDYTKATDDELMDACKQFEAYFLEQMFKEMMKTIPESDETSSSNSQLMDYYKDEMVQQIASDSAEIFSPWVSPLHIPTQVISSPSVDRIITVYPFSLF